MIVVDTSALIDFFRGSGTPAALRLEQLEADGTPFGIPAICVQEVLQGARDASEWKALERVLEGQELVVPLEHWQTHREAARIYFDCRRRSITLRGTVDCLIAAMVLERDGTLLHDDRDFESMKAVRALRTLTG